MNAMKMRQLVTLMATSFTVLFFGASCSMNVGDEVAKADPVSRAVVASDPVSDAVTITTYASWETLTTIQKDLKLPKIVLVSGTTWNVVWSTSNAALITSSGVVTRPANSLLHNTVTLTATISSGSTSVTKTFACAVVGKDWNYPSLPVLILNLKDGSDGHLISPVNLYKCYETLVVPPGSYVADIASNDVPYYGDMHFEWYINDVKQSYNGVYGTDFHLFEFSLALPGEYQVKVKLTDIGISRFSYPLLVVVK